MVSTLKNTILKGFWDSIQIPPNYCHTTLLNMRFCIALWTKQYKYRVNLPELWSKINLTVFVCSFVLSQGKKGLFLMEFWGYSPCRWERQKKSKEVVCPISTSPLQTEMNTLCFLLLVDFYSLYGGSKQRNTAEHLSLFRTCLKFILRR